LPPVTGLLNVSGDGDQKEWLALSPFRLAGSGHPVAALAVRVDPHQRHERGRLSQVCLLRASREPGFACAACAWSPGGEAVGGDEPGRPVARGTARPDRARHPLASAVAGR